MTCDRCGRETLAHTMSIFNTETICLGCKEIESAHPEYEAARSAEAEQVRQGNYNYAGVGLPADLRRGES